MKILLIDDEKPIIDMYKDKLSKEGLKVIVASDGESGMAKAKQDKPDVILLDVIMPKINGLDILKQLKNDPATKAIPVYLLTNIPEGTSEKKAEELGASGYLFKAETEPGALVDLVKKLKG